MSKPIVKKVMPSTDVFIQFTEDEQLALGMEKGDKYTVKKISHDTFILRKFATIKLEMEEFSRESIQMLVAKSCEEDKSCNEVISDVLTEVIKKYDTEDDADGPRYDESEAGRPCACPCCTGTCKCCNDDLYC